MRHLRRAAPNLAALGMQILWIWGADEAQRLQPEAVSTLLAAGLLLSVAAWGLTWLVLWLWWEA